MLEDERSRQDLGNIIFVRQLICDNEFIQKAEISQRWKKNLDVCYLREEKIYVEIFDEHASFVFFDSEENRYIGSVAYQLKPIWTKEQIQAYCEAADGTNEHFVLYKGAAFERKQQLEDEDFPVVLSALKSRALDEDYEQQLFEKVLDYYWEHEMSEELKRALSYVDWKNLKDKNRIHMIRYFIAGELYNEALKGIEQYGYQFLDKQQLCTICLYALTTLSTRRSELLVEMCEYAFSRGEENSEIVAYLQRYFHGTKEEMLAIFEAGNKGGMYDRIFVESVLKACIADGVDGTEFKVFSTYIQQVQTDTALIDAMLVEYVNFAYEQDQILPEEFYELIGKKIDIGKMDWMYQQLYLDYYKDKKENLSDRCKGRIEKIKDHQVVQTDHVLPVLFQYLDVIKLPKYLCARTFIEFRAKSGQTVIFHFMDGTSAAWKEEVMKELLPGYYVFSASIFDHKLNDHYVTIEGEERRYRDQVVVTDHLKYCKGSRFYELNELIRHQQDGKLQMMMEEYAVKTMMVQFIKPMTEE